MAKNACPYHGKFSRPERSRFKNNLGQRHGRHGHTYRGWGKTWSVLSGTGAEKLDFRGIKAFDALTAVIISSGPAEKGEAKVFRTTDGGKSWKQVFGRKAHRDFL